MGECKYGICTASDSHPDTRGLRGCACMMEERREQEEQEEQAEQLEQPE